MTSSGFGLFGTGLRTKVLIAIGVLDETHASELAQLLGAGVTTVVNAIDTLRQSGVVSSVVEGKTRRVRLDPRFRAYDELKALLDELALGDPALLSSIAELRRRPRRAGKPI